MDSAPKRPWYRLRLLTWVLLVVIVCTLIDRELRNAYGFPVSTLSYLTYPEPGESLGFTSDGTYRTLTLNLLFCLPLIAATAHVFELWLRSPNRLHLSLVSLFGLIGMAAFLTAIVNGNVYDSLDWLGLPTLFLISWYDLRQPLNWPLMLALGCTIYSLGWLACFAALRCWSLVRGSRT